MRKEEEWMMGRVTGVRERCEKRVHHEIKRTLLELTCELKQVNAALDKLLRMLLFFTGIADS